MAHIPLADDSRDSYPVWLKTPKGLDGFSSIRHNHSGDNIRVELFDGLVYMIASPDEWHQWILGELGYQLNNFLDNEKYTTYIAPLDIRLFPKEDGSDNTVCQPDVFVVCDREKTFGKKYCNGAPDFIIEVMSESSRGRDLEDKKFWYGKAGVKEYWVVSKDRVYAYRLGANGYDENVKEMADLSEMSVEVLPGCVLKFDDMKKRYGV